MAKLSQLFTGWRFGLARATGAAALVTVANILFLAITIPSMPGLEEPGLEGALFTGDCSKAKQLNTWSHLVINILGTVLLAAGNYTQQVLTAPTRAEIDRAHTKQQWLDIGVSSIRNLNKISGKRTFAWIILGLSSIPVHLLYIHLEPQYI
ncbi:uncharacterized protein CTRU02_201027 [Colletotrichum truncatum]|uniref:Uncharacterized protein n=1 Tax=Colletotrichum truncatum TaxID=5467 RepID=A0ACC3ZGE6_COLTU|nr:uncharacterized protein CTRU02_12339 [Colletotrichum truncatum]KAF6784634.1 hypothetical protein CTRU02_12339 [Colletotrichum truncatum]